MLHDNKRLGGTPAGDVPDEMMGHEMCNVIMPGKGVLDEEEDGTEIELTVKGRVVEEDGMKHLLVTELDGVPVVELKEEREEEKTPEIMEKDAEEAGKNLRGMLAGRPEDKTYS